VTGTEEGPLRGAGAETTLEGKYLWSMPEGGIAVWCCRTGGTAAVGTCAGAVDVRIGEASRIVTSGSESEHDAKGGVAFEVTSFCTSRKSDWREVGVVGDLLGVELSERVLYFSGGE
jgi:hypothetical protein